MKSDFVMARTWCQAGPSQGRAGGSAWLHHLPYAYIRLEHTPEAVELDTGHVPQRGTELSVRLRPSFECVQNL